MKILIINKSDSTGGAAVVSRRLMEALRAEGEDARMLVAEKLTDSPYIAKIAPEWRLKMAFTADRLRIAVANGGNRKTLFKLDAAAAGIDISRHKWAKEADAIIINWINQGVLSLKGIAKLGISGAERGRQILWVMHDMWNFTGLCHHAGRCRGYTLREPGGGRCGLCPMLGRFGSRHDLSYRVNLEKGLLYHNCHIKFIAVSNWLADKARESRLLSRQDVRVIPNAFPIKPLDTTDYTIADGNTDNRFRLIFGAARLDDPIKDFPTLIESFEVLKEIAPELSSRTTLTLFGGIKDKSLIGKIPVSTDYCGVIHDSERIASLYIASDAVISTSRWETLPGTLIEGQAYGAWPIAFPKGGQGDIIEHGLTGWLAGGEIAGNPGYDREALRERYSEKAVAMAEGIMASAEIIARDPQEIRKRLHASVESKFSAGAVARAYIRLLKGEEE